MASRSRKGQYPIPFDRDGSLLSYPERTGVRWKDNHSFVATLSYHGYERGRSAAHLLWRDDQGRGYPMFLTDFDELLRVADVVGGKVTARWTFTKRGSNYGVCLDRSPPGPTEAPPDGGRADAPEDDAWDRRAATPPTTPATAGPATGPATGPTTAPSGSTPARATSPTRCGG